MGILDTLQTTFTRQRSTRTAITTEPLILSYDGQSLSVIAGKSVTTSSDGSLFRGRGGGGYREIGDNERGYIQAYMGVVWCQAAVDIHAQKIAEIMHQGEVVSKTTGKKIENHPLLDSFEKSRREWRHDLFRRWAYWRTLTGESYIEPVSGTVQNLPTLKLPFGFRALNSLAVEPRIARGEIVGFDYTTEGQTERFKKSDLIYDMTFNPMDDNRGKSALGAVIGEMNISRGVVIINRNHIKNNLHPRVVFVAKNITLTDTELELLKKTLAEQGQGPANAGRPLILPAALDAVTLKPADPSEQKVYISMAQQAAASATKVPLPLIVHENNPYQLAPEQRQVWYDISLLPEAQDMAFIVNVDMLPRFDKTGDAEFRLPLDSIRANLEDPKARSDIIKNKYQGGWITFNQAQAAEGLPAVNGGDFYLFPSNLTAVQADQLPTVSEQVKPKPQQLQLTGNQPMLPSPSTPLQQPPQLGVGRAVDSDTLETIKAIETVDKLGLDELVAWQKFHRNGTKRAFKNYMIRDDIADALRAALDAAGDAEDAIKAAFDEARQQISIKAIQATRLDFELEVESLVTAARAGDINRTQFGSRLRTAIRKAGERAWRDGLADGGVILGDGEPLSEDDAGTVALMVAEQSPYVSDFGAVLFKEDGITDAMAANKPTQWFARSVQPIYHAALANADANGMYEYAGPVTETSCATCAAAAGQRHRLKDWARLGLIAPHGHAIECSDGGLCKHVMTRVNARASGNLQSIPRAA